MVSNIKNLGIEIPNDRGPSNSFAVNTKSGQGRCRRTLEPPLMYATILDLIEFVELEDS